MTVNGRTAQTLILAQPVSSAEKYRQIWDTIQRHALMFNVNGGGDLNGRHNLPGAPMLDPLMAGLVALGLGWLLIRPRDWRTLMLLGWAAVSMSGGILTLAFEAPQGVRTFGITPVLAVLGVPRRIQPPRQHQARQPSPGDRVRPRLVHGPIRG